MSPRRRHEDDDLGNEFAQDSAPRARRCRCLSASHGPSCSALDDRGGDEDAPGLEHVASVLPRVLRELRGPSRRPRPDVAPLVDSQCRVCRTIWRSCRKERP